MINSLITSFWLVALACVLIKVLRAPVLRFLGPRVQYSLWLAVPLAAVLPWLPKLGATSAIGTNFTVTPSIVQNAEAYISSQQYAWAPILASVWAAGTLAIILWMLITTHRFYRRFSQATISQANSTGLRFCHSNATESPAIVGIFRALVLLPINFEERYSPRQQELIVAHEHLHWQRGDLHFNLFAYFLLALNWFNPLVWMAYRSYRQDQELACDAAILAKYPQDTKTYAEALLTSSLAFSKNRNVAFQFGTPHLNHYGAHPMKQRIQHLATQRGYSHWPLIAVFAAAAATWLFLMSPATANQLVNNQSATTERAVPAPIVRVNPRYPEAAVEQGLEGIVEMRFDITEGGTVENIWVEVSRSDEIFHDAAVEALEKWRFHPEHADTDYRVALEFKLP